MILPPPFTKLARSSAFERTRTDAPPRRVRRIDLSLTEIESEHGFVRVFTQTVTEIEVAETDAERTTERPSTVGW